MRVAYIIHNLTVGGAETLVVNYLIELKKNQCDVSLIQFTSVDTFLLEKLKQNDIPVYTIHPTQRKGVLFRVLSKLDRIVREKRRINHLIRMINPDIIHCHTSIPYIEQLDLNPNQIFYTFHTAVDRAFAYAPKRFREGLKILLRNGGQVIALSKEMKQDVLRNYPMANVKVIPNGVSINAIRDETYEKKVFLRELGLPENAFVVGHVGRFHPVKNHEKLIDIFAEIKRVEKDACLLLVGSGDSSRTEKLHQLVREYGLDENVFFLGERADATRVMSVFDLFLLPSVVEGFSLVLVEAQAHGVRSIATDSVPEEVVINPNCFKMDVNKSSKEWCDLALGKQTKDTCKQLESVDIQTSIQKHIEVYRRALRQ